MSRPTALDCLVRWLALTVVGAGLVALTPTHLPGALAGSIIIAAASVMCVVRLCRPRMNKGAGPLGSGAVVD